jgi:hypothetical protein
VQLRKTVSAEDAQRTRHEFQKLDGVAKASEAQRILVRELDEKETALSKKIADLESMTKAEIGRRPSNERVISKLQAEVSELEEQRRQTVIDYFHEKREWNRLESFKEDSEILRRLRKYDPRVRAWLKEHEKIVKAKWQFDALTQEFNEENVVLETFCREDRRYDAINEFLANRLIGSFAARATLLSMLKDEKSPYQITIGVKKEEGSWQPADYLLIQKPSPGAPSVRVYDSADRSVRKELGTYTPIRSISYHRNAFWKLKGEENWVLSGDFRNAFLRWDKANREPEKR